MVHTIHQEYVAFQSRISKTRKKGSNNELHVSDS
jgi:hypothetical protein